MKLIAPIVTLVICYVFFFTYVGTTYGNLPSRLATHFDIQGRPNGWMSRDNLIEFIIGFGVFMPALIVGIMSLTGRVPVSFVNLPDRDYWLAKERRKATSELLLRFALWFASMNVLFITGLHWLIIQANAPGDEHLSVTGIVLVVGGFLMATLVWIILLTNRFGRSYRPESNEGAPH